MTCVIFGSGILCFNGEVNSRLKVGSKYIFFEFHRHCGPTFFTDVAHTKEYYPMDENDPVWPPFEAWLAKRKTK